MVDTIAHHRRHNPEDPTAFGVSLLEDKTCVTAASWEGKLL